MVMISSVIHNSSNIRAIVGSIALHICVVIWSLMHQNMPPIKPEQTIKITMVKIPPMVQSRAVSDKESGSVKKIQQTFLKPKQNKPVQPLQKNIAPTFRNISKQQSPKTLQKIKPIESFKPISVPLPVASQTENNVEKASDTNKPYTIDPPITQQKNQIQATSNKITDTKNNDVSDQNNTNKTMANDKPSASFSDETTASITTGPQFGAAYLHNPAPEYPASAKRRRMQGKVLLNVTVDAIGQALYVNIAKSSGFSLLDMLAKNAVSGWRFIPAKRGEQPIQANVIVPIEFRLE